MRVLGLTTGRLVRFALLACTLVGLALMHTLGHNSGVHCLGHAVTGHDAGPSPTSRMAVAQPLTYPVLTSVPGRSATGCPDGGCGRTGIVPIDDRDGHLPVWAVCLAVVGVFAVVLLAVGELLAVRSGRRISRGDDRRPSWSRAPPPAVGLRLARVSVLRV